jgi:hypothetical protein
VRDGSHTLFWKDHWLNGCSIRQLALNLWEAVPSQTRNSRMVRDALRALRWVRDIVFARTVLVVVQYLHLWDLLRAFHLSNQPDRFVWKWSSSGEFSASSVYNALFVGTTHMAGADHIWKIHAPGRCGFFGWLVFAWSLLDLEPVVSAWLEGYRRLCALRVGGRNSGPFSGWVRLCSRNVVRNFAVL